MNYFFNFLQLGFAITKLCDANGSQGGQINVRLKQWFSNFLDSCHFNGREFNTVLLTIKQLNNI